MAWLPESYSSLELLIVRLALALAAFCLAPVLAVVAFDLALYLTRIARDLPNNSATTTKEKKKKPAAVTTAPAATAGNEQKQVVLDSPLASVKTSSTFAPLSDEPRQRNKQQTMDGKSDNATEMRHNTSHRRVCGHGISSALTNAESLDKPLNGTATDEAATTSSSSADSYKLSSLRNRVKSSSLKMSMESSSLLMSSSS